MHEPLPTTSVAPLVAAVAICFSYPSIATADRRVFDVRIGVEIQAGDAAYRNLQVSFVLPRDWPEQDVEILDRDESPGFHRVSIVDRPPGARQVNATLARIDAGQTAHLIYRLRITRRSIQTPSNPSKLRLPTDPPRESLGASPMIETGDRRVQASAKRVAFSSGDSAWSRVQKLDAAAKSDVRYSGVAPLKGARAAIVDGHGDCEERTSVFVAYCRIHGIPARSVWIPGHAYAEFLLEDPQSGPRWFPVESVRPEFGFAPANYIILQKGDSYRVAGHRGRQRYITETLRGQGPRGAEPPRLKAVLEVQERAGGG